MINEHGKDALLLLHTVCIHGPCLCPLPGAPYYSTSSHLLPVVLCSSPARCKLIEEEEKRLWRTVESRALDAAAAARVEFRRGRDAELLAAAQQVRGLWRQVYKGGVSVCGSSFQLGSVLRGHWYMHTCVPPCSPPWLVPPQ